jgi:hypothetical protein
MSKSVKVITAKPFNQKKESEKNGRKIKNTIDAKVNRERELYGAQAYDMRKNIRQAFMTKGLGGIYDL